MYNFIRNADVGPSRLFVYSIEPLELSSKYRDNYIIVFLESKYITSYKLGLKS